MTWSKVCGRLDLNLALVVLLTIFALAPLTHPAFFQSHSGFLPVFNLYDLEGDLWGNWGWIPHVATSPDILRGDGPLPYLLAELPRWLGVGGAQAIKGIYALGFVVSGLTMYLLSKRSFGPAGGLLAAVVYTYLPFHLATVYVRGAFAEAWAFALYPLVLLCWDRYLSNLRTEWAALAVLCYAALASTQLGLALLYALILVIYVAVVGPSRQARIRGLLLAVVGLGASLLLQLPTLWRYGLPTLSDEGFAQHFVYPFQLLSSRWGYGVSVPGWGDTLPLQLGLAATGLTLVVGMLWLIERELVPTLRRKTGFFVAAVAVMILLVLPLTSQLWQASRLSFALRYPWQLLSLAGFAMAAASGAIVRLEHRLARLSWQAVLVTLVVVASYSYLTARYTDVQVGGSPVAILGDEAALLAYQREGPLRHGATVRLTLDWQGLRPMETDYTVFVHVVDQDGTIWAQRDSMPVDGERPTSSWQPGELIEDRYELMIDVDGPREGYAVEVGLYDQSTGMRVPLADGATVVILG
jgi:hypothetical protein